MSLKYALLESYLNNSKKEFTAQVQEVTSYDQNAIIKRMASKGSTLTEADILACLTVLTEVVAEITAEGASVNMGLFKSRPSISGVFPNASDNFNNTLHKVKINLTPSIQLKKAVEQITPQKVPAPATGPHIVEVRDAMTGSINDRITSGGGIEVSGRDIKVAGMDVNNGVYFIAQDGTESKVATLITNEPSTLILIVPTLTAGAYSLQIRTQYSHGVNLKTPKIATFGQKLTVS